MKTVLNYFNLAMFYLHREISYIYPYVFHLILRPHRTTYNAPHNGVVTYCVNKRYVTNLSENFFVAVMTIN